MGKLSEILGTLSTQFQIGIGGTGLRRLRFRNSFSGDLEWEPTANRTIALPDESGTIALLPTRKVGFACVYTGLVGGGQGWFDDYDGKWVYLSTNDIRTIGNTSSGAGIAAAWTLTLFTHIWLTYDNADCPVLDASGNPTSRAVGPATDFNANKRITLPDYRGRVIGMFGAGSGLTSRDKGVKVGTETHTLAPGEMPEHSHSTSFVGGTAVTGTGLLTSATSRGTSQPGPSTNSAGAGAAHNNMQPTAFEHWVISAGAR